MDIVGDDFTNFIEGEVVIVSRDVKFSELNLGPRIGMVFSDLFPDSDGGFGLVEGRHGFGKGH